MVTCPVVESQHSEGSNASVDSATCRSSEVSREEPGTSALEAPGKRRSLRVLSTGAKKKGKRGQEGTKQADASS